MGQEDAGIHTHRLQGDSCPCLQAAHKDPTAVSPHGSSRWALFPDRGRGSQEEVLDQAKNIALSEGRNQVPVRNTFLLS